MQLSLMMEKSFIIKIVFLMRININTRFIKINTTGFSKYLKQTEFKNLKVHLVMNILEEVRIGEIHIRI